MIWVVERNGQADQNQEFNSIHGFALASHAISHFILG